LKLIYIAGAYRSRSLLGVVRNIFRARLVERKRRSDGSGNACERPHQVMMRLCSGAGCGRAIPKTSAIVPSAPKSMALGLRAAVSAETSTGESLEDVLNG
jgi:hypothetical protein